MAALKRIRDISSWSVLVMIASLLLAEEYLSSNFVYPYNPHAPPPGWALGWRQVSFFGIIALSLISLPRWQSILGIITILLFIYYLQSYWATTFSVQNLERQRRLPADANRRAFLYYSLEQIKRFHDPKKVNLTQPQTPPDGQSMRTRLSLATPTSQKTTSIGGWFKILGEIFLELQLSNVVQEKAPNNSIDSGPSQE